MGIRKHTSSLGLGNTYKPCKAAGVHSVKGNQFFFIVNVRLPHKLCHSLMLDYTNRGHFARIV